MKGGKGCVARVSIQIALAGLVFASQRMVCIVSRQGNHLCPRAETWQTGDIAENGGRGRESNPRRTARQPHLALKASRTTGCAPLPLTACRHRSGRSRNSLKSMRATACLDSLAFAVFFQNRAGHSCLRGGLAFGNAAEPTQSCLVCPTDRPSQRRRQCGVKRYWCK